MFYEKFEIGALRGSCYRMRDIIFYEKIQQSFSPWRKLKILPLFESDFSVYVFFYLGLFFYFFIGKVFS